MLFPKIQGISLSILFIKTKLLLSVKLTYKFAIIYGDCFFINDNYKKCDLKDEISKLKEIRKEQDLIVKEIYALNPITRLIYGKQFEFIYNYLM